MGLYVYGESWLKIPYIGGSSVKNKLDLCFKNEYLYLHLQTFMKFILLNKTKLITIKKRLNDYFNKRL